VELIHDLSARANLDADQTATGLGTLLFAVRMGIDARTWDQVKSVIPDAASLLSRASPATGRTAEIVSFTAPGAVRKALAVSGIPETAVTILADALRDLIRTKLSADAAGRAVAALDRALG
jgi:hypothetical protein